MKERLTFLILLMPFFLIAQKKGADVIPVFISSPQQEARYAAIEPGIHKGYVITLAGDTLSGMISFRPRDNDTAFGLFVNDVRLGSGELAVIRLEGSDPVYSNLSYTEFRRLKSNSNRFYRKIMEGDNISIYDDWLLVNESPGTVSFEQLVIRKGDLLDDVWNFWATSDKRELIRLVNTYLNKQLKYKEFKDKYEVLVWLKKNI